MSKTVNLRDYYPLYTHDEFVEVADDVAAELCADKRYEKNHERGMRRNKVLSLDAGDGTETEASMACHGDNPETVLEMVEKHRRLCRALNSLPPMQGRRVEARYLHGRSIQEIAIADGVSDSSAKESIDRGLKAMKKVF